MIHLQKLVVVLPSFLPFNYEANTSNDFYHHSLYSDREPQLNSTMKYNTMTMDELIEINNNDIMDDIFIRGLLENEQ